MTTPLLLLERLYKLYRTTSFENTVAAQYGNFTHFQLRLLTV